jgi:hypothetical protein
MRLFTILLGKFRVFEEVILKIVIKIHNLKGCLRQIKHVAGKRLIDFAKIDKPSH